MEIPWGEVDFELEPLLSAIDVRRLRVFTEKLPETREISLKIPSSCRFFQLHDFAFQRFLIIDLSEAENLLKIHLFNWKISDLGKESEKAEKIVQLVQKFYGPLKRNRVREISEAENKAFEGKLNEFDVDLRQKGEWKEITFNSINLLIKFKVDLNCSYSS
ncbi:unnamed protein product, partial [Mesorhabditis belari]|uniref:Uncharacterized protein n=1 Tax=Mesorhabditis belari TaxID=2138241 RepID=A0AAF3FR02_9BILA